MAEVKSSDDQQNACAMQLAHVFVSCKQDYYFSPSVFIIIMIIAVIVSRPSSVGLRAAHVLPLSLLYPHRKGRLGCERTVGLRSPRERHS